MQKQARQDTAAERLVQEALRASGIQFSVGIRPDPEFRRTGDLVLEDAKIVIMVNGCFWHGCPDHSRPTKSHTKWWGDKIAQNKERDEETIKHWKMQGWDVAVYWEHEHPDDVVRHVTELLQAKTTPTDAPLRLVSGQ